MERVLKIRIKGSKEVVERVEAYIEDVLSQNTSHLQEGTLEEYEVERLK